jgi:membrane protein
LTERPGRPYRRRDVARHLAQRSFAEFAADRCSQFAAAISYHVLFSLFPLAILLVAIFGLVVRATGVRADAVDAIASALPLSAEGTASVRDLLRGVTGDRSTLGLIGFVGLVYAASGMMAAIRGALGAAFDVTDARPFLRGKLIDLGLIALAAAGAIVSLGLIIALRFLGHAPHAETQLRLDAGWAGWLLGTIVPLSASFSVVFGFYRFVVPVPVRSRRAAPVALGVAILFVVAENLFALYVGHFANYNAIYGSLGAIIAFMVFVHFGSMLFLLGAEVVSEWPRAVQAAMRGEDEAGADAGATLRQFLRGLWTHRAP